MKPCPNCRVVYADDYAGTCAECGAPMGSVKNTQAELGFAFARQSQQGAREGSQEQQMRRGNYGGVKIEASLLDVARSFVIVDESKLVDDGT